MSDSTEDQPAGNGRRFNRSRMALVGVLALVVVLVGGGLACPELGLVGPRSRQEDVLLGVRTSI